MPDGSNPARISSSVAAWTQARASAKMFLSAIRGTAGRNTSVRVRFARLTQFRGRVKEPGMLDQRVTIGHAGNIIGDPADTVLGAEIGGPFRGKISRIFCIVAKQVQHDPLGLAHDANDARMPVHGGIEKVFD